MHSYETNLFHITCCTGKHSLTCTVQAQCPAHAIGRNGYTENGVEVMVTGPQPPHASTDEEKRAAHNTYMRFYRSFKRSLYVH